MPGLNKRREEDIRADRFESELYYDDVERMNKDALGGKGNKVYMCSECHALYAEKSVVCPRCDKKRMGRLVTRWQNRFG